MHPTNIWTSLFEGVGQFFFSFSSNLQKCRWPLLPIFFSIAEANGSGGWVERFWRCFTLLRFSYLCSLCNISIKGFILVGRESEIILINLICHWTHYGRRLQAIYFHGLWLNKRSWQSAPVKSEATEGCFINYKQQRDTLKPGFYLETPEPHHYHPPLAHHPIFLGGGARRLHEVGWMSVNEQFWIFVFSTNIFIYLFLWSAL